jgi:dihydropyrimidinase
MDYSPFDGMELVGRPQTVISRGEVIIAERALNGDRGRGNFLPRQPFDPTGFSASPAPELGSGP